MKEYILCACNYYNDEKVHTHTAKNITSGFIVCRRRHHNCIDIFAMIVGFPYTEDGHKLHKTEVQGFLTNTNRFVGRKEALKIAIEAKQLIHDIKLDSNIGLTSEDVW